MIQNISNMSSYTSQLAGGTKLQGAADGAAELAIVQGEKAQIAGYDAGTRNAEAGKSVLDISDSALGVITDNLQRIRELAAKASNSALLSNSDRQAIQDEVEQLKQGISDIAQNTEFNTKKLLDGSNTDMYIASGADGSGTSIHTGNATLQALGIEDFDVTKDFSLKTIDDALEKVSSNRSSIGAQSNSMDYAIGYNTQTAYNLTAATSRMEDTDYEKAATERDKEQILQTYRFIMQGKQQEAERQKLSLLYM
jgi:flagellin